MTEQPEESRSLSIDRTNGVSFLVLLIGVITEASLLLFARPELGTKAMDLMIIFFLVAILVVVGGVWPFARKSSDGGVGPKLSPMFWLHLLLFIAAIAAGCERLYSL
jgi:hypothetical protein